MEPCQLGVAVVGLGVGEQHALAYAEHRSCEIRWLYDLDAGKSERVRQKIRQGRVATDFRQILDDEQVKLVSVASYDDAHFDQVLQLLNARKHVFVEKPLCRTLPELRAIKLAWQNNGKPHLSSNLVLRGAPLYQWLGDVIKAGELGDIYAFDGEYLYGRLHKITEGWRKHVPDYSVMEGGGIHLLDLMMWLTNEKPWRVTAFGNRICTEGTEFHYSDYVAAAFEFGSGIIGRITANFGCVHRHQHVLRVFGTKGTFLYDDAGARLHRSSDPAMAAERVDISPLPINKGALIPGWVAAIIQNADPEPYLQQEMNLVSACVAADDSLAQKQPVNVVYV